MFESGAQRSEAQGREDEVAALNAVAEGDRAAFEWLFRRYHRRVQGFVRRMIDRPDLVDEVTNDTLFAVWRAAGSFAGRSSVSTWIFGIAYRQALKGLDGRIRHERLSDGDERMEEVSEQNATNDPETQAMSDSSMEALERELARLGPDQRAVVELTGLGHSQEEIAAIVDCPTGTVKTRLFHARRKLRELDSRPRVAEA